MTLVALQPAGSKDARVHYVDTIENPVPLSRVARHVDTTVVEELRRLYGGQSVRVWGVTPGNRDRNRALWDKLKRGHVVLFARAGHIVASAVVVLKTHNRELALELWKTDEHGNTWEYVYFLDEVTVHSIPYRDLNRVVGYKDSNVVQGFTVLDEEKSARILSYYDFASEVHLPESESFDPKLDIGQVVTSKTIEHVFGCSTKGGMNRSKKTGTLVLFSSSDSLYRDRWDGKVLHYTGMGQTGDQSFDLTQNKTLAESRDNGVEAFLFDKLSTNKYLFHGRVVLADSPYLERQPDKNGNLRNVCMFPLRYAVEHDPPPIPEGHYWEAQTRRERAINTTSTAELKRRLKLKGARGKQGKSARRSGSSMQYDRDPIIVVLAKRRANGICELCDNEAPFKRRGEPYLEVHHIVWLSEDGPDTLDNAVALCPNCHRKMHSLKRKKDITLLKDRALRQVR